MERLQGPPNSCFFGEHLEVNCLEQGFVDAESNFRLDEDEQSLISSSLEDNMPFLQMLQSVESSPPFFPFKEPSFHTLVRLQQHLKKPWEGNGIAYIPTTQQAMDFESCDMVEIMQSPLKSESNDLQRTHSALCAEKVGYDECSQAERTKSGEDCSKEQLPHPQVATRERKKRKRARQARNKEDVENQRMTHIAVERNRRRQMNDHLGVLKSLMPPSYIQRGDHASIIGGAIDFVKELEQLFESLEAQKRMRKKEEVGFSATPAADYGMSSSAEEANCGNSDVKAERKSEGASIEVTVIQTHVNLKIQCRRRHGQLVKAIVALEELRLTILHLNITSSEASVLYSFNLKIEEESKLGSANEIAAAVDHIFSFING